MITVNGITHEFNSDITLQELLVRLELSDSLCAVEVNNTLISHKQRDEYKLQEGDTVEIVSLVGGG